MGQPYKREVITPHCYGIINGLQLALFLLSLKLIMAFGFPQKTKTVEVTWIDKMIVVIGKDRYHHHDSEMQEIKGLLKTLLKNQHKLMATVQELKDQVADLNAKMDDLQATVDAEQAQIQGLLDTNAQVVTDLNAKVAELQAIIDAGGTITPADLTAISEGITTATDKLATTKADLEGTV
jgi:uncharacterized protein YlxW (UPF0749 family)